MNRYGKWEFTSGENVSYGNDNGEEVIMQLMVDDGVSSRGHRTNIFKKDFKVGANYSGSHKQYNFMTVLNYGGDFTNPGEKSKADSVMEKLNEQGEFQMPDGCVGYSMKAEIKMLDGKAIKTSIYTCQMNDGTTKVITKNDEIQM